MTTKQEVEPTRVTVEPALAVQVQGRSGTAPPEIGEAMRKAFDVLGTYRAKHDIGFAGPPRAYYTRYDPSETAFTVAFPVAMVAAEPVAEGGVQVDELPGGPALRFVHTGPYDELKRTYGAITDWLRSQGMLESEADWSRYMPMWEEYVTDPTSTPADELVTFIYLPLPQGGLSAV